MADLASTAQRYRVVKESCMDFLIRWAVDDLVSESLAGDRLYLDVLAASSESDSRSFSKLGRRIDD